MAVGSDVIVVGAGHNGLVAATFLARAGLSVRVLEGKAAVGGAAKTEHPFAHAPRLGTSTGAYLLGLMPPELVAKLRINLPLLRRLRHPVNRDCAREQMLSFFSAQDFAAHEALQKEIGHLREDVHSTWLEEPLSIEDTADRYVRPAHRATFVDLCRRPVGEYLERFGFKSDLLKAMYAVTDGFAGVTGGWDTPGTGMNFLVHNMCRLRGSDGTWMIVRGGMGTVTRLICEQARSAGASIETGRNVREIEVAGGTARGVVLEDGEVARARVVLTACDPFRMRDLVGPGRFPEWYEKRLAGYRRDGTTMKVNLALRGLPRFTCLPEDRGQFGSTMHLLPDEAEVLPRLKRAFAEAQAGVLPEFPTIEWYVHTTVDPSLRDPEGHHNSALFVQWVPYKLDTCSPSATDSRRGRATRWWTRSRSPRRRSSRTSASRAATSTTSITRTASRTGCPIPRRSRASTPGAQAAIRPARSSEPRATTRPLACSTISASGFPPEKPFQRPGAQRAPCALFSLRLEPYPESQQSDRGGGSAVSLRRGMTGDNIALLRWLARSVETGAAVLRDGRLSCTTGRIRTLCKQPGEWRWIAGPHAHTRYANLKTLITDEGSALLATKFATRTIRFDTGKCALELRLERLRTARGEAVVVVAHDVTGQVREELERLRDRETRLHEQRMHAMGVVASGVAHDLNHALNVIALRIARLRADPGLRSQIDSLESIARRVEEAAGTVARLQDLARRRRDRPSESVDLSAVLLGAVEMARSDFDRPGPRIEIHADVPPLLPANAP